MDNVDFWIAEGERLRKQNKILELKNSSSLANNLCPGHRDKQAGKSCLACEIERLREQNKELVTKLKKVRDWMERMAIRDEKEGKKCQFKSLKQAYIADAKNYRAMIKDINTTIAKTQSDAAKNICSGEGFVKRNLSNIQSALRQLNNKEKGK